MQKDLVLTKDLNFNDMLSCAVTVFSYQLVAPFVLSDGFWESYLCPQGSPVHLNKKRVDMWMSYHTKQTKGFTVSGD